MFSEPDTHLPSWRQQTWILLDSHGQIDNAAVEANHQTYLEQQGHPKRVDQGAAASAPSYAVAGTDKMYRARQALTNAMPIWRQSSQF